MTPEEIEARLAQLQVARDQAAAEIRQREFELNQIDGAIADCKYWLAQAKAPLPDPTKEKEI